jgi:type I restriction enzyme M protein
MDQLRASTSLRSDEILEVLFALLAVRARSTPEDWRDLRASPPDMLGRALDRRLMAVADVSVDVLLSRTFSAAVVAQAIDTISSPGAPVGEIADYLIEQFAGVVGRTGDNYAIPPSIRRLVISMAQPTGVIYDPAAGFGQLLIDAAAEAGSSPYDLLGQERSPWACTMAQLNLVIHGIHAEIVAGDVFRHDMFPQLRAHRVMAVPPFGPRQLPSADEMASDPRWVWGEPGANDVDVAWIEHCLFHLADNGRAVLVLPNRILFRGGRAGRIRQRIVKAGLLDAVVALPPGLFHSTSVAPSLLVFVKGRASVKGEPAPTLMIDTRNFTPNRARPTRSLSADLIAEVAELYHEWAAGTSPDSDLSAVAHFDDLAANDFVIDPARYVPVPRTAWDADEAATDRAALIGQLEALTQASRAADDHLEAVLKGRQ